MEVAGKGWGIRREGMEEGVGKCNLYCRKSLQCMSSLNNYVWAISSCCS